MHKDARTDELVKDNIPNLRAKLDLQKGEFYSLIRLLQSDKLINRILRDYLLSMIDNRGELDTHYMLGLTLRPKHQNKGSSPQRARKIREFWISVAAHHHQQGYYDLSPSEYRKLKGKIYADLARYIKATHKFDGRLGFVKPSYKDDSIKRKIYDPEIMKAGIEHGNNMLAAERAGDW